MILRALIHTVFLSNLFFLTISHLSFFLLNIQLHYNFIKYEYEYLYEYYPRIIICPSKNFISIKGKKLSVQLIKKGSGSKKAITKKTENDVIESRIDGEFEGWDGETIFKLTNGQIWQQTDFQIQIAIKLMPKVLIYNTGSNFKMQVEGIEKSITVTRLK